MATQSNYPGSASTDAGIFGNYDWVSPENITVSDDVYATCTIPMFEFEARSYALIGTDFGFAVTGTINGITVEIDRKCDTALAAYDFSISIIKGGTADGTDQSAAAEWPTTETVATFGGVSELWGLSWTPADINASDFGVQVQFVDEIGGGEQAFVDSMRITIDYTPPPTKTLAALGVG